jgi:hypothetical protein
MSDSTSRSRAATVRQEMKAPASLEPLWPEERRALAPPAGREFVVRPRVSGGKVRGEFIAWLVMHLSTASEPVQWIRIHGAQIDGPIDFRFAQAILPTHFYHCILTGVVRGASAEFSTVTFSNCKIRSLAFGHSSFNGSLRFAECEVEGIVGLYGSRITEELSFTNSKVSCSQIIAIYANSIVVGQININDTILEGRVSLLRAEVKGDILFSGSAISATGIAFHADGIVVRSRLFLTGASRVRGIISLIGARIDGEVNAEGLDLEGTGDELALIFRRARIGGAVYLNDAKIVGAISFLGASIEGDLLVGGTKILSPLPFSLDLRFAKINGACSFENGFTTAGGLFLYGAEITGELRFADCIIASATDARRIKASAIHISKGFRSESRIEFYGSKIGGDITVIDVSLAAESPLAFASIEAGGLLHVLRSTLLGTIIADGASLSLIRIENSDIGNDAGIALHLENARIRGSLILQHTNVRGGIFVGGTEFQGDLVMSDYLLEGSAARPAIDATGAVIKGAYRTTRARAPVRGAVRLRNCKIGSLEDNPDGWPSDGSLEVDGLTYDRMPGVDAKARLKWLALERGFHSQPFEQLTKLLRSQGDNSDAADVAIAKWRKRRSLKLDSVGRRYWDRFLDVMSGYGYRPLRPLTGLLAVFLAGAIVFSFGYDHRGFCPSGTKPSCEASSGHPEFNPWIYSLESLVPVGDFGQKRSWVIRGNSEDAELLEGYSVLHRALGWLFALLLALAPTNILRRE